MTPEDAPPPLASDTGIERAVAEIEADRERSLAIARHHEERARKLGVLAGHLRDLYGGARPATATPPLPRLPDRPDPTANGAPPHQIGPRAAKRQRVRQAFLDGAATLSEAATAAGVAIPTVRRVHDEMLREGAVAPLDPWAKNGRDQRGVPKPHVPHHVRQRVAALLLAEGATTTDRAIAARVAAETGYAVREAWVSRYARTQLGRASETVRLRGIAAAHAAKRRLAEGRAA